MENVNGRLISMVLDLVDRRHTLIAILPSPILIMNIVPAGRSAQIVGVRDVSVLCRVIHSIGIIIYCTNSIVSTYTPPLP